MSWALRCKGCLARDILCCMLLTHAVQQLAPELGDSNELLVHQIDALGT